MALKLKNNDISPALDRIQRQLATVPSQAHKFFVSVTPKDTGRARSKTVLRGNTIDANYPYAKVLDNGWSQQAPKGMVQPTVRFLERLLRRIIRK